MAKKPSFFEKLTGTNWEESEKKSSEDKSIIEEKAPKAKKVKPVKKVFLRKKKRKFLFRKDLMIMKKKIGLMNQRDSLLLMSIKLLTK